MFKLVFSSEGLKALETPNDQADAETLAGRYAFLASIAEPLQQLDREIRATRQTGDKHIGVTYAGN